MKKYKFISIILLVCLLCTSFTFETSAQRAQVAVDETSYTNPIASVINNDIRPSISFNQKEIIMSVGEKRTIGYTRYPATGGDITWVSHNESVVYPHLDTGIIEAKAAGTVNLVIAFMYGNYSVIDYCLIHVVPKSDFDIETGVYKISSFNSGKYLQAETNGSVTLGSPLPTGKDASQLWFVENYGTCCKIFSMGQKYRNLDGQQEAVLGYDSSAMAVYLCGEKQTYNKWIINHLSTSKNQIMGYELDNKQLTGKNDSLSFIKTYSDTTDYPLWTFEKIDTNAFNNYYNGQVGIYSDKVYLKIKVDSSVYTNGYYVASDFDAYLYWWGLSPNVVVYGPNDTVPSDVTPYVVTIVGSSNPNDFMIDDPEHPGKKIDGINSILGHFIALKQNGTQETNSNNRYYNGKIYLNVSPNSPIKDNNGNTNQIDRKAIIAHELGHALKLAHPFDDNIPFVLGKRNYFDSDYTPASIMNWGKPTEYFSNILAKPMTLDLINFKNKWN